jgi:hypothetical protein
MSDRLVRIGVEVEECSSRSEPVALYRFGVSRGACGVMVFDLGASFLQPTAMTTLVRIHMSSSALLTTLDGVPEGFEATGVGLQFLEIAAGLPVAASARHTLRATMDSVAGAFAGQIPAGAVRRVSAHVLCPELPRSLSGLQLRSTHDVTSIRAVAESVSPDAPDFIG